MDKLETELKNQRKPGFQPGVSGNPKGNPLTMVDYKARGSLYSPHSEQTNLIGDKELRTFEFPEWEYNKILYIEKEGVWETLKQTGGSTMIVSARDDR